MTSPGALVSFPVRRVAPPCQQTPRYYLLREWSYQPLGHCVESTGVRRLPAPLPPAPLCLRTHVSVPTTRDPNVTEHPQSYLPKHLAALAPSPGQVALGKI